MDASLFGKQKKTKKTAQPTLPFSEKPGRRYDENGYPLPLPEEILEGDAWLTWAQNPDDEAAHRAYVIAFNALQRVEPHNSLFRCAECGTLKWGRGKKDACGHCGATKTLMIGYENGANIYRRVN